MILYSYYRSTSSYRVRIALELKKIRYRTEPINLVKNGGEQRSKEYLKVNPQGRVPTLVDGNVKVMQSPAIIEYLEELNSSVTFLPGGAAERALARSVASIVACDIHPLHNVSVLKKLRAAGYDEESVQRWIREWILDGFRAVEELLGDHGWALGEVPGLADIYLLPQVYAARRFGLDVGAEFPKIARVEQLAAEHPAFQRAHPAYQVDSPVT